MRAISTSTPSCPRPSGPSFPARDRAFTLIELLTVIAIIGVLAAILIPVVGRVRKSASSAQCSAHMREIGTALQLFSDENRGRLPSPASGLDDFHGGQGPWFNREPQRLQNHISRYLSSGISASWSTTTWDSFDRTFSWPAFLSAAQPGSPSVLLNKLVLMNGSTTGASPFKRVTGGFGRKLDEIDNRSIQRVFIEVDQKNAGGAGWASLLPPEPVHGSTRNALFYDWHVGKVPVN